MCCEVEYKIKFIAININCFFRNMSFVFETKLSQKLKTPFDKDLRREEGSSKKQPRLIEYIKSLQYFDWVHCSY